MSSKVLQRALITGWRLSSSGVTWLGVGIAWLWVGKALLSRLTRWAETLVLIQSCRLTSTMADATSGTCTMFGIAERLAFPTTLLHTRIVSGTSDGCFDAAHDPVAQMRLRSRRRSSASERGSGVGGCSSVASATLQLCDALTHGCAVIADRCGCSSRCHSMCGSTDASASTSHGVIGIAGGLVHGGSLVEASGGSGASADMGCLVLVIEIVALAVSLCSRDVGLDTSGHRWLSWRNSCVVVVGIHICVL